MARRPMILPSALLLFACLAVLPACKKSKPTGGGDDPNAPPATTPGQVPPAAVASSDYLLYAHVRAKDVIGGPILAEVKQAVAKAGMTAEWDKFEEDTAKEFGGVKPTEIETVTVCIPEFPAKGEPQFVAIVTTSKPINRTAIPKLGPKDARGFHSLEGAGAPLVHFPGTDDKTVVLVSQELAQKYLDGYGKNRTGWPLTGDLTKAAAGHTAFAVVNLGKLPKEMLGAQEVQMAGPLLQARTVTLTADVKGKELGVAIRASFPDAATAGKAKETVQGFIALGAGFIQQSMNSKEVTEISAGPAVKEAHRALTEAKVDVSGSDLVVTGSYKADFDVGAMAVAVVKKVRGAGGRMTSSNNLKQIGIALHNFSDRNGGALPVHAVAAKGAPLKGENDKPLLSWRVAILPYIEQDNLYKQFKLDEPWDGPNNKKLIEMMPKTFAPVGKPGKPGYTPYQMVIGPKALWPTGTKMPASFLDGTSNTIAVVEAAEPVIWTKPDDVMLPGNELPKDLKKKFGGQFPGGFNALLWDGSVRFIPDSISERTLGLLLDPKDGMPIPDDF